MSTARLVSQLVSQISAMEDVASNKFNVRTMGWRDMAEAVWYAFGNVREPWQALVGFSKVPELVSYLVQKTVESVPPGTCLTVWHYLCVCARFYVLAQMNVSPVHPVRLTELALFNPAVSAKGRAFLRCGTIFATLSTRWGNLKDTPLVSLLFTSTELAVLSSMMAGCYFAHDMPAKVDSDALVSALPLSVVYELQDALCHITYAADLATNVRELCCNMPRFVNETRRILLVAGLSQMGNTGFFGSEASRAPDAMFDVMENIHARTVHGIVTDTRSVAVKSAIDNARQAMTSSSETPQQLSPSSPPTQTVSEVVPAAPRVVSQGQATPAVSQGQASQSRFVFKIPRAAPVPQVDKTPAQTPAQTLQAKTPTTQQAKPAKAAKPAAKTPSQTPAQTPAQLVAVIDDSAAAAAADANDDADDADDATAEDRHVSPQLTAADDVPETPNRKRKTADAVDFNSLPPTPDFDAAVEAGAEAGSKDKRKKVHPSDCWPSSGSDGEDSDTGAPPVRITGRAYQMTTLVWDKIREQFGDNDELMALHGKFQRRVRRVHGRVLCSTAALKILRRIANRDAGLFLLLVCQILTYTQTKDSYATRQAHWMELVGTVDKIRALAVDGKLQATLLGITSAINHYVSSGDIGQASQAAHFQVLIDETLKKIGAV